MSLFTPGWLKKALHLRTIVLCIPKLTELPPDDFELFDAMRSFNRGTIDAAELQRRWDAISPSERTPQLHEPLDVYGWNIKATLHAVGGAAWWFATVTRTKSPSEKDKKVLAKVLDVLGCDPARDILSVSDFDRLVAENVPVMYWWPNTFELQEIQFNAKGDMRMVPRGSRATDGYQKIPDEVMNISKET